MRVALRHEPVVGVSTRQWNPDQTTTGPALNFFLGLLGKRGHPIGKHYRTRHGQSGRGYQSRHLRDEHRKLFGALSEMATTRKKGKKWYIIYRDEHGKQREIVGCTDRRETERMARDIEGRVARVRAGLTDPQADAIREHRSISIDVHLGDFESNLRAKGNTLKHALVTANRARRVVEAAGIRSIAELVPSRIEEALAGLRNGTQGVPGRSIETVNHHVRAIKSFSRWLQRDGRCERHVLAHLSISNPELDRRRVRRALTPSECSALIRAAESGRKVGGLEGSVRAVRAVLYAIAVGTGFRASELRSLTPESLSLDAPIPIIRVRSGYTKNRKEAVQPLHPGLAEWLLPRLSSIPMRRPIFEGMTDRTAEMLRVDLEAASIIEKTEEGVIDFHSLRHTYASMVVRSGASVKTSQELLRHSTPVLTIGRYAHADIRDRAEAVSKLPTPGEDDEEDREPLNSTAIENSFASYLPASEVASCRILSDININGDVKEGAVSREDDGVCRTLSDAGGGTRTRMGVTPRRILSPLRLPIPPLRLRSLVILSSRFKPSYRPFRGR